MKLRRPEPVIKGCRINAIRFGGVEHSPPKVFGALEGWNLEEFVGLRFAGGMRFQVRIFAGPTFKATTRSKTLAARLPAPVDWVEARP